MEMLKERFTKRIINILNEAIKEIQEDNMIKEVIKKEVIKDLERLKNKIRGFE